MPSDTYCFGSTEEANEYAAQQWLIKLNESLENTPCNQMKTNAYVSATATKQGCPSNCTAPTASAYWSPGTVNVDCGGDGSSRRCFESCDQAEATRMAQEDANRLAQEKANAMECDCPEETKYGGIVIELPTGYGCIFDGTGTFSGISVGVSGCGGSVIGRNDRVPVGNYGSISGRGCTGSTLENCNPNGTWTAYIGSITEGVSKRIEASIQS